MKTFIAKILCATLPMMMVVGCGGGGGSSGSDAVPSSAPVATSVQIEAVQSNGRYDIVPDIANCNIGKIKDVEKQNALSRVNYIRALHGLPAVTYNAQWDAEAAQAALIMVASNTLTHHPDESMACYSAAGKSAASTSNLYYVNNPSGTLPEDSATAVNFYLTDYYNDASNEPDLGHRLWLLDPFVTQVAFGRVDGSPKGSSAHVMASSLKVIGGTRETPLDFTGEYVAYPVGNYPKALFEKSFYLSFSAIADRSVSWKNGSNTIDYSASRVQVFNANMQPMTVTDQAADFSGYGLGNVIKWKMPNLQDNQTYTVKITDVKVNGILKTYDYSFKLV